MSRYSAASRTPCSSRSSSSSLPRTPFTSSHNIPAVLVYDGEGHWENPAYSPIQKFIPLPNVDEQQYSTRVCSPLSPPQPYMAISPMSPMSSKSIRVSQPVAIHPVLNVGSASSVGWRVTSPPSQFSLTFTAEDDATCPALPTITIHMPIHGMLPVVVGTRPGLQAVSYQDVLAAIHAALRCVIQGADYARMGLAQSSRSKTFADLLPKGTWWNGIVEMPSMGVGQFRMKTPLG